MQKETILLLKEMAEALPPVYETVKKQVNGIKLIRLGYKKSGSGQPISKKKQYTLSESVKVDHFARCKDLFKKKGIEAVREYCNKLLGNRPVIAQQIETLKAEQEKYNQEIENFKENDDFEITKPLHFDKRGETQ